MNIRKTLNAMAVAAALLAAPFAFAQHGGGHGSAGAPNASARAQAAVAGNARADVRSSVTNGHVMGKANAEGAGASKAKVHPPMWRHRKAQ